MAKAVDLGNVIVRGYLMPIMHSLATLESLAARTYGSDDGHLKLDAYSPEFGGMAMAGAHAILLHMLDVQATHFRLPEFDCGLAAQRSAAAWGHRPDSRPSEAPSGSMMSRPADTLSDTLTRGHGRNP